MLDVEDVEDVSCTVDDIESTDRFGCLVQRGWSGGRWDKCTRGAVSSVQRRGCEDRPDHYGIICSRLMLSGNYNG